MSKGAGYKINVAWLDRVQEVVDYAYNEDVYVIIDVHHEYPIYCTYNLTFLFCQA